MLSFPSTENDGIDYQKYMDMSKEIDDELMGLKKNIPPSLIISDIESPELN